MGHVYPVAAQPARPASERTCALPQLGDSLRLARLCGRIQANHPRPTFIMKFKEYSFLLRSDLHRYAGNSTFFSLIYNIVFYPGFKYSLWMRTCAYLKSHLIFRNLFFPFAWLILQHYEYKYGISISYRTQIGSGLYIGHFGGIVVHPQAIIGKNCNLSHQITLGQANRGGRKGYPVIGDNVYIGPGAKVIGNVRVGNNVAIGANCVVTKDVPDNGVVGGVPGKIISLEGSAGYVNKTDYEYLQDPHM